MKPDLPSSTVGLAVLISACVVAVSLALLLLVLLHRRKWFVKNGCGKWCRWCCCNGKCCKLLAASQLPPDQVREFLNMEDLLLEVDDGGTPARLATTSTTTGGNNADDNHHDDEGWTVDTLVPNILKSRSVKRRDSRGDLLTPLL